MRDVTTCLVFEDISGDGSAEESTHTITTHLTTSMGVEICNLQLDGESARLYFICYSSYMFDFRSFYYSNRCDK